MSATMHSDGSSHNVVDNHTSVSHNTDSDCTALVQESLQLPTVVVESVETIPEDNIPHPICPHITNCQSQSSTVSASPHTDSHNDNNYHVSSAVSFEIPSPLNLEIVCVQIESTNPFLLCTVYLPPNPDLSHFEAMN